VRISLEARNSVTMDFFENLCPADLLAYKINLILCPRRKSGKKCPIEALKLSKKKTGINFHRLAFVDYFKRLWVPN
jgi:hypothetical protein